jgi:hypothetical protein
MRRKARAPRDDARPALTDAGPAAPEDASPGSTAESAGKTPDHPVRRRKSRRRMPGTPVERVSTSTGEPIPSAAAHWIEHIRRRAPRLFGPDGGLLFETFVSMGTRGRPRLRPVHPDAPVDSTPPHRVPQRGEAVTAHRVGGHPPRQGALPAPPRQGALPAPPRPLPIPGSWPTNPARTRTEPGSASPEFVRRRDRYHERPPASANRSLTAAASNTPDPPSKRSPSPRRIPASASANRTISTPTQAAGPTPPPTLDDAASEAIVAVRWYAPAEGASPAPRPPQPWAHVSGPEGGDLATFVGPSAAGPISSTSVPRLRRQPIEGIEHSGPVGGWPTLLEPLPHEDIDWRSAERLLARQARLEREQRTS